MNFKQLSNRLSPFLLEEKYIPYDIPTKSTERNSDLHTSSTYKYLMYDFYVLDYLKYLLTQPPKQFRELPSDLEASVEDAVAKLFPFLREELLDAVYFSICAEMRHARTSYLPLFDDYPREKKIFRSYLKYREYGNINSSIVDIHRIKKPITAATVPESELHNDAERRVSFLASKYAQEQTNTDAADFVRVAEICFRNGTWSPKFGGPKWGDICSGWLMLYAADTLTPRADGHGKKPMSVAIDHVYDLQHNTNTVFNKVHRYSDPSYGYSWVLKALDHKRDVKNYFQLLDKCSGAVKSMARPVLYNRLGHTWEAELREYRPSDMHPLMYIETPSYVDDQEYGVPSKKTRSYPAELFSKDKNSKRIHTGGYGLYIGKNKNLTKGKVYRILNVTNHIATTVGNNGQESSFLVKDFTPVIPTTKIDQELNYNVPPNSGHRGPFNIGDKVRCVDVSTSGKTNPAKQLTVGEIYVVLASKNSIVAVQSNDGIIRKFKETRFEFVSANNKSANFNGITSYILFPYGLPKSIQDAFFDQEIVPIIFPIGSNSNKNQIQILLSPQHQTTATFNPELLGNYEIIPKADVVKYGTPLPDARRARSYSTLVVVFNKGVEDRLSLGEVVNAIKTDGDMVSIVTSNEPNPHAYPYYRFAPRQQTTQSQHKFEDGGFVNYTKGKPLGNSKVAPGTKVICVDNNEFEDILDVGEVYTVSLYLRGKLSLEEAPGVAFYNNRFVIAKKIQQQSQQKSKEKNIKKDESGSGIFYLYNNNALFSSIPFTVLMGIPDNNNPHGVVFKTIDNPTHTYKLDAHEVFDLNKLTEDGHIYSTSEVAKYGPPILDASEVEKGDIVVCCYNGNLDVSFEGTLTVGKKYEVTSKGSSTIYIKNDLSNNRGYYIYRFAKANTQHPSIKEGDVVDDPKKYGDEIPDSASFVDIKNPHSVKAGDILLCISGYVDALTRGKQYIATGNVSTGGGGGEIYIEIKENNHGTIGSYLYSRFRIKSNSQSSVDIQDKYPLNLKPGDKLKLKEEYDLIPTGSIVTFIKFAGPKDEDCVKAGEVLLQVRHGSSVNMIYSKRLEPAEDITPPKSLNDGYPKNLKPGDKLEAVCNYNDYKRGRIYTFKKFPHPEDINKGEVLLEFEESYVKAYHWRFKPVTSGEGDGKQDIGKKSTDLKDVNSKFINPYKLKPGDKLIAKEHFGSLIKDGIYEFVKIDEDFDTYHQTSIEHGEVLVNVINAANGIPEAEAYYIKRFDLAPLSGHTQADNEDTHPTSSKGLYPNPYELAKGTLLKCITPIGELRKGKIYTFKAPGTVYDYNDLVNGVIGVRIVEVDGMFHIKRFEVVNPSDIKI